MWSSIRLVGSGYPGQRTITSGLWRSRKTSTSWSFQASSSVCINSALRSSAVVIVFNKSHFVDQKDYKTKSPEILRRIL